MEAEKTNRMIVSIFHSHPAPPKPSSTDLLFMRLNPCVWMIARSNNAEVKAYQLRKGELHKVDLIITDLNP
jgi:proteasome lid subunit RPN8/RPN11